MFSRSWQLSFWLPVLLQSMRIILIPTITMLEKKQKVTNEIAHVQESPIAVDEQTLVASTSEEVNYLPEGTAPVAKDVTNNYASLSKAEKREVKKEAVKAVKEYVKAVKAGENEKAKEMAKAMDSNLRWAAIFGVIGVAGLIIGDVFGWIGGIAIIIAAVFLVIYILEQ